MVIMGPLKYGIMDIFTNSSNVTLNLLNVDGNKALEGQTAGSSNSSLIEFDYAEKKRRFKKLL